MSLALALSAPPPTDLSPAPACITHDRSGGSRATVTHHAVRRFADRVMGLEPVLEGLTDREAIDALRGLGYDVDGIRGWLAYYGYPSPPGARTVSPSGGSGWCSRGAGW